MINKYSTLVNNWCSSNAIFATSHFSLSAPKFDHLGFGSGSIEQDSKEIRCVVYLL